MLTKNDFKKMREIVREELESESESLKSELRSEIKLSRMQIETKLNQSSSKLKNLEILGKEIQKDLKVIVNYFDREYLVLKKDVDLIKSHLNVSFS
jgi:hypothetical protein